MGLFNRLGLKPKDRLIGFLSDADEAYTRAFSVKNVAGLENYFTRKALSKIMKRVRFSEKAYSGLERYKHVTWKKVSDTVYIKMVTYDDVQISKGVKAPVGESFNEEWTMILSGERTMVDAIRRLA